MNHVLTKLDSSAGPCMVLWTSLLSAFSPSSRRCVISASGHSLCQPRASHPLRFLDLHLAFQWQKCVCSWHRVLFQRSQCGQSALTVIVSGTEACPRASSVDGRCFWGPRNPWGILPSAPRCQDASPECVTLSCSDLRPIPKLAAAVIHLWDFYVVTYLLFKVLLPKSLQNESLQLCVNVGYCRSQGDGGQLRGTWAVTITFRIKSYNLLKRLPAWVCASNSPFGPGDRPYRELVWFTSLLLYSYRFFFFFLPPSGSKGWGWGRRKLLTSVQTSSLALLSELTQSKPT